MTPVDETLRLYYSRMRQLYDLRDTMLDFLNRYSTYHVQLYSLLNELDGDIIYGNGVLDTLDPLPGVLGDYTKDDILNITTVNELRGLAGSIEGSVVIYDSFNAKDESTWTWYGPASVDETAGELVLPLAGWGPLESAITLSESILVDMNAGSTKFQLDQLADATPADSECMLDFELGTEDGFLRWRVYQSTATGTGIECWYKFPGQDAVALYLPYDAGNDVWFKIASYGDSRVRWQTSPDGTTQWNTRLDLSRYQLPPLNSMAITVRANGVADGEYRIGEIS